MKVLAVLLVAAAASCINVGKALQKQGTKGLPRLVLDRKVLATYFKDKTWATGLALDVAGGILMVAAIARAPVSLVQPVAAGGVAVLAVFSHFRLEEKLRRKEWAGVVASVVGTVGIGVTSEEQRPVEMTSWRYLAGGILVLLMLALPAYLTRRTRGPAGRGGLRGDGGGGGLLGGGGKKIVGVLGAVSHGHHAAASMSSPHGHGKGGAS